jgi:hypothetical protein
VLIVGRGDDCQVFVGQNLRARRKRRHGWAGQLAKTCENSALRFTRFILVLLVASGHGQSPAPVGVYRLDDQFKSPAAASAAAPIAEMAAPIVWRNFLSEDDITWGLLRGRIGYRKGDLIVKGDGSTPVIVSPDAQPIDWTLYEAVEIRMLAEGGGEIKIRIGSAEFKQPIGSAGEYRDYRFDVNVGAVNIGGVRGSRPLAIMPTDSLTDPVAISSIKLVPRTASFPAAAGKLYFGKGEEYRNVRRLQVRFGTHRRRRPPAHFAPGATLRFSVPMVPTPMNAPVRRSFAPSTRLALKAVVSPSAAVVKKSRRLLIGPFAP